MSPIYVPGKVVMRRTWQPMDPDAAAYITAVETADGQALEERVKIAIDNFVLGCKADGIWSAIKASCILAGARTLNGALVPLVGTAPTNLNFVAGDYSRKTGLVGNGNTKYLSSNRNNNADPQNNKHVSAFSTVAGSPSVDQAVLGSTVGAGLSATQLFSINTSSQRNVRVNDMAASVAGANTSAGLWGVSRSGANTATERFNQVNITSSTASVSPTSGNILVFARNSDTLGVISHYSGRLAFYSIGESLNLALLEARVTDLINAIGAAIP